MVLVLKVRVKREAERAELRWKLWLREKAILVWARLTQEMIRLGRSCAQYGVRVEGYTVALCFDLGFRLDSGLA